MKEGMMEIPSMLSDPSERLARQSRVQRRARTRRPCPRRKQKMGSNP